RSRRGDRAPSPRRSQARRSDRHRRRPAAPAGGRKASQLMVKRIVSFALYQPLFLLLLVGLFIAAGVVAFQSLPVEAFPDVTDIQTTVITLFPGTRPRKSKNR